MKEGKPNILFYFSDQQRYDTLGCYGQPLPISPVLDQLASEGTKFEYAFTAQPVCGPCRALLQTGLMPTATGCFRNNIMLPLGTNTIAKEMKKAGYENAYVGKWHLASEGALEGKPGVDYQTKAVPLEYRGGYDGFWRAADVLEFTSTSRGGYIFDENNRRIDFDKYRTDAITDQALLFLDQYDGKKPFFLTVSHIEPHHQNTTHHYEGPEGSKEKYKDFDAPPDLAAFPEGDWKEEYPDYLGACNAIDRNLGRLVDKLKEKGLYENTVIIFMSDHGSHFRTRNHDSHFSGYDDYKRTCHDAALRVPLIIKGDVFDGGGTVESLVSTASIPRTIMSIAGVEDTSRFVGEDLRDLIVNPDPERPDEVFAQVSESRVGRVIRTRDFMYSVYAPGKDGGKDMDSDLYADDFLYDLRKDPYELNNLIEDHCYDDVKEDLRKRLLRWIAEEEHIEARIVSSMPER